LDYTDDDNEDDDDDDDGVGGSDVCVSSVGMGPVSSPIPGNV
jgi:hypothetical protein